MIEGLHRLNESTRGKVICADIRRDQDVSIDWIHYAFDSFSEAAEVAKTADAISNKPEVPDGDHAKNPSDGVLAQCQRNLTIREKDMIMTTDSQNLFKFPSHQIIY